ncbi:hypothetical protein WG906_18230 [Pedobacter sp. P351]|uniref:hypothetical protein n=1 Tax=Pedobacter superstes TaxID=3133441 RepID=UPI0030AA267D
MEHTDKITLTYNDEIIKIEAGELAEKYSNHQQQKNEDISIEDFITESLGCQIPTESTQELESFKKFMTLQEK